MISLFDDRQRFYRVFIQNRFFYNLIKIFGAEMRNLFTSFKILTLLLFILFLCRGASQDQKSFLVETKLMVDGKIMKNNNISLYITNQTLSSSFEFDLSPNNFNKNVTVLLRMFAWYNGQWTLSRQTAALKITEKRSSSNNIDSILLNMLKFNSKSYSTKLSGIRQSAILQNSTIIISYDPQSSLLVSRLQDPQVFQGTEGIVFTDILTSEEKRKSMKIQINFKILVRSDQFIAKRGSLIDLTDITNKIRQGIPLIANPIAKQVIEPYQILRIVLNNYEAFKKSQKIYQQKTKALSTYSNILYPKPPNLLPSTLQLLNTTYNIHPNSVSIYYFIFQQSYILDRISNFQSFLKQKMSILDQDGINWTQYLLKYADIQIWVIFIAGGLWIILDIVSYGSKIYSGVSISYGFFLIAWIIVQLPTLSFRVGAIFGLYYGLGFAFLYLILIKLIVSFCQKKQSLNQTAYTTFDKLITERIFNLLIIALISNIFLHFYIENEAISGQIAFRIFHQFQKLLSQYYYFLVMIPPLLLSFRLKSTAHIGWIRMILFFFLAIKDDYLAVTQLNSWQFLLFRFKEEIIFTLLLITHIIYRKGKIQIIQPPKQQKQESEVKIDQNSQQKQE